MSLTAGTVVDKISEIRSKIAILKGLVEYLKANYLGSDAGDAEMKFTREDYAMVPPAHVLLGIADISAVIEEYAVQLKQWEDMVFTPPQPKAEAAPEKAKANGKQGDNRKAKTKRKGRDAPGPRPDLESGTGRSTE